MSQTAVIILIAAVVLVAINIAGVVMLWRRMHAREAGSDQAEDTSFNLLLQQMNELSRTVDTKMADTTKSMNESIRQQFTESQRVIKEVNEQVNKHLNEVTKGVTEANQASKQVFTVAEQLQNLEQVLKNQKQRGNLGEASLDLILSNILPPTAYRLQYGFADGTKADAVIHTKEGVIPVDAKFSLDNYNRMVSEKDEHRRAELEKEFRNDLKKRIDETAKYIRPKEETLPFAFMFIPAEGIYYDLLVNEIGSMRGQERTMIDYAYHEKNVVIVSPTTFAAYLQSVLYGFKAFSIEQSAQEIRKRVGDLSRHLSKYDELFKKIGSSLSTTVNHYNAAEKELGKVDKDIVKITDESSGIEAPQQLERPSLSREE